MVIFFSSSQQVPLCQVVVLDHAKGAEDLLGAMGIIHGTARAGAHALLRLPVGGAKWWRFMGGGLIVSRIDLEGRFVKS